MSILFLSRLIPESIKEITYKSNKKGMPEAAIALQNKILRGIKEASAEEISMINVVPISSYPHNSALKSIPSLVENYQKIGNMYNVGFDNRTGIRSRSILSGLKQALEGINDVRKVIVYTGAPFFLDIIKYLKRRHAGCEVILVLPDLPEYSNLKSSLTIKEKVYSYLSKKKFDKAKLFVDAMVLLTEQTAAYLHWEKPYVVVEGIAETVKNEDESEVKKTTDSAIKIVYTGTTHRQFGLPDLVAAYELLNNDKTELIICGYGDYDSILEEKSKTNPGIKFLGIVPHDEAKRLQEQASILVNPRKNEGEYTKYSFPSKTMEYLVTGHPVIAYKLDGIPDEYDPYILYAEGGVKGLAKRLSEVASWSETDRSEFGKRAQTFVRTNKNERIQAMKILSLFHDA